MLRELSSAQGTPLFISLCEAISGLIYLDHLFPFLTLISLNSDVFDVYLIVTGGGVFFRKLKI